MKTEQLQIRVTTKEKREIKRRAQAAGGDISAWVLRKLLRPEREGFEEIIQELEQVDDDRYVWARLHDFLVGAPVASFEAAVAEKPAMQLSELQWNILAAMLEQSALLKDAALPEWVGQIEPLDAPWFASQLKSLRMHLLMNSPPAYRRRGLFIDAPVGSRV